MKVIIYTTTTCPYCKMLISFLKDNNIRYSEKLVDQDEAAEKEMMNLSDGFMGVPFVVIEKDDGKTEKVKGFDKGRISDILNL